MAEGDGTRAQHLFAEDRALRVHHRERGVVADRTEVAQVIRDPLKLRHHRTHPYRARWRVELERRLDGESVHERIRHRTVPGRTRRNSAGVVYRLAAQQLLDAFVRIAEALFQSDNRLAARREPEMTGLDDPRMDRAHRNLMQTRPFSVEESVRWQGRLRSRLVGQWPLVWPAPVIKPMPLIRERRKVDAEQIADCALQARCGRMKDRE